MTPLTVNDLTQASLEGTGVFDVLMRANKAHLEAEFSKNRIKGPEYSTVYLGALESVMQTALQFLLQKDRNLLEAQLLEQQILIAQQEVLKAQAEVALVNAQIAKMERDDALVAQQILNLQAEILNIPKQGALIDSQKEVQDQQKLNLISEEARITAQISQINQQTSNAVIEADVLRGQKCKLDAEFDVLLQSKLKTAAEVTLLGQKTQTEKAQTIAMGVDTDSVIGRQKVLYAVQAAGFERDAEQKAADLMLKTWMTRRTTDEATVADATNMLHDPAVGRAVNKLLSGVNA